jgi:cytochrome c6
MIHNVTERGNTRYRSFRLSNLLLGVLLCSVTAELPAMAGTEDHFSPALVKRGEQTYLINCSRCHGVRLVNPAGYTFDLRHFPPNERDRFFHSVTQGKGNMPAWGDLLKPDQIEALWAYIKTEGAKQRK